MLESDDNNKSDKMFLKILKTCHPLGHEKWEGVGATKVIIINYFIKACL